MVFQDSTNLNHISKYIVDANGDTPYSTIQAALNAANTAGGNALVYVRAGSYVENLTLYDTVDIECESVEEVSITGTHTPPASGRIEIRKGKFLDASAIFSSLAAGTTEIITTGCTFDVTGGHVFDLDAWTGTINVQLCDSESTADGIVNNTIGTAVVILRNSTLGASGNTFTTNGTLTIENCRIQCECIFGGAGSVSVEMGSQFDANVALSGTIAATFKNSSFASSTDSAITFDSATASSISNCIIDSSTNPAIAGGGAGTISISNLAFLNNANFAGTLTYIADESRGGNMISRFVVDPSGDTPYKTIGAANTAATAAGGGTVYVRDGTYTEDITFSSDVNIEGQSKNTTILIGDHLLPSSGNILFKNIQLRAAVGAVFSSAGPGTTTLRISDCIYQVSGSFLLNASQWTGTVEVRDCIGTGTNDRFAFNTSTATFNVYNSTIGEGPVICQLNGTVLFDGCTVGCQTTFDQNANVTTRNTTFLRRNVFQTNATLDAKHTTWEILAADEAIRQLSSSALQLSNCVIDSSAAEVMGGTGLGVITLGEVTYLTNSAISSTLTVSRAVKIDTGQVEGTTALFTTFDTNVAAAAVTLTGITLSADGTDADIDINITPKGTGDVLMSSVDINGGTIDDTVIGGTTPAAGDFTTVNALTSVTSPIYTTAAGSTNINSAAGQNIQIQMGDAAGANKISFEDSASAEVASVDSNGIITGTTIFGTTFDTNVAAAAVTLAGTTLSADGTDVNIPITITPKGSEAVTIDGLDFPTADGNAGEAVVTNGAGVLSIGILSVAGGGTGAATLTDGGFLLGSGTAAITATAQPTNGQLPIGSTGADPTLNTLTGGTGVSITNGAGSITIDAGGGGVSWTEVTGTSQAMAINNGYIANNAGLVTLTLPAAASIGDVIKVTGKGAGGWRVAQNAGQTIYFGSSATTTGAGGRLDSTDDRDSIKLVCVTANNDFNILSSIGNPTVT